MLAGDERVLSLVRAGDLRDAATLLIRAQGRAVLRYLRALLRDDDLAGDAFSLFAEWSWVTIGRFRGRSSLRTWAFGIAWNAAQRVRDEAWQRRKERLETGEASGLAQEILSSSPRRLERQADRLRELRQELSPAEQNLLVLRLDQKLSWEEIAAVLSGGGESASAAVFRKRFERLKERIRQMARERGFLDR